MIEPRRRSWQDISSCNSTNNIITTPINDSTSIDSHTPCSLNSSKFHIPSSPSPNCSSLTPSSSPSPSSSPLSDFFYSQISPSVFSSPRHHHHNNTTTKRSHASSSSDQEDYALGQQEESVLESFIKEDEEKGVKEVNATNAQRVSYSTEYKSVVDNDAGLVPLQILEVLEEEGMSKRRSSKTEETVGWRRRSGKEEEEVMKWPPVDEHQASINRPKPFGVFLEEIKKREFDGEVDAWKEEQNLKLMDKLQRKEDDIHKWELKQTRLATMRMKKIEGKWERKRAKALERLQKKIAYVQEAAEAKKVRVRRSTDVESSWVSTAAEKMKTTRRSRPKFFCIF